MRVKRNGRKEKAPQKGAFGELPDLDSNQDQLIQSMSAWGSPLFADVQKALFEAEFAKLRVRWCSPVFAPVTVKSLSNGCLG